MPVLDKSRPSATQRNGFITVVPQVGKLGQHLLIAHLVPAAGVRVDMPRPLRQLHKLERIDHNAHRHRKLNATRYLQPPLIRAGSSLLRDAQIHPEPRGLSCTRLQSAWYLHEEIRHMVKRITPPIEVRAAGLPRDGLPRRRGLQRALLAAEPRTRHRQAGQLPRRRQSHRSHAHLLWSSSQFQRPLQVLG